MGTRLEIQLLDGTPAVMFNETLGHSTPIELSVLTLHPQAVISEDLYMQAISFAFQGVTNHASGRIGRVLIERDWFGKIEKYSDSIEWSAIADKKFVVVYDISRVEIKEHLYMAEAVRFKNGGSKDVEPVWNEALITPTAKTLKEGLKTAIEIATEYPTDYKLVWGHQGKKGLFVINPKGKKISMDEISDDETFILFSLLTIIASKSLHTGVFFINGLNMSDTLLESLVQVSKTFYRDGFIFIKRLDSMSTLPRKTLKLPILK